MRVRDVPLGARSLAATQPAQHFNMLAVHWIGPGAVAYRTRSTAWAPGAPGGRRTPTTEPVRGTTATSTGRRVRRACSSALEATSASARRTSSGRASRGAARSLALAGGHAGDRHPCRAGAPTRRSCARKPSIAPALKLAVVHHTAGTNTTRGRRRAAIVRGIEDYHVQGNGWNDIGYNFLVDRFGTVYEGRAGGIDAERDRRARGGFNTGTVGVALIGNFTAATPPKAKQDALVELLAWRLDLAHVDPLSTVAYTSGGNAKFRAGKVVTLRAISGHRDTGPSECPGKPRLRAAAGDRQARRRDRAAEDLLADGRSARSAAPSASRRASRRPLPWTVTVDDQTGKTVATRHAARGAVVDWTWSSPARQGRLHMDGRRARGARRDRHARRTGPPPPPPPAHALADEPGRDARR